MLDEEDGLLDEDEVELPPEIPPEEYELPLEMPEPEISPEEPGLPEEPSPEEYTPEAPEEYIPEEPPEEKELSLEIPDEVQEEFEDEETVPVMSEFSEPGTKDREESGIPATSEPDANLADTPARPEQPDIEVNEVIEKGFADIKNMRGEIESIRMETKDEGWWTNWEEAIKQEMKSV